MLFKKKKLSKPTQNPKVSSLSSQFIFIEVPVGIVAPEVISWGESKWWPKDSLMKFTRLSEGEVKVGTLFRQESKQPFGPSWISEITKLDPRKTIEWTFKSGMFQGYETIVIGERANGTRIDYEMLGSVRGAVNKFLWKFIYQKKHHENISRVLAACSEFVQKKHQERMTSGSINNQS
jgi:hypothetical protein